MDLVFNSNFYNDFYAKTGRGDYMERANWIPYFKNMAQKIVEIYKPKTVLDAGCACGYLVECLRDLGVEAYGFDISEYAIENVREDVREFCFAHNVLKPLPSQYPQDYDLVTNLDVLEHLFHEEAKIAIKNLCRYSKTVIFSSTPNDVHERTHVNVRLREYWTELFFANSYHRNLTSDCSYISEWCVVFEHFYDVNKVIYNYELNMRIDSKNKDTSVAKPDKSTDISTFKVYFDYGDGFFETDAILTNNVGDNDCIIAEIDVPSGVVNLRFDPSEVSYLGFKNIEITVDSQHYTDFHTNGRVIYNGVLFDSLDPQLIVNGIGGKSRVVIQAQILIIDEYFVKSYFKNEAIIENKEQVIATLEEKNKDLELQYIEATRNVFFSKVYLDYGKGFVGESFLTVENSNNEIDFTIDLPAGVHAVRFDPIDDVECILKNIEICADYNAIETYTHNGVEVLNGVMFSTTDSQVYISDIHRFNKISIKAKLVEIDEYFITVYNKNATILRNEVIRLTSMVYSSDNNDQGLRDSVAQKEAMIDSLNLDLKNKEQIISSLNSSISKNSANLQLLEDSIAQKDEIINSLNVTISGNDEGVQALRDSIAEKERVIDSLSLDISDKVDLLDSLNKTIAQNDENVQALKDSIAQKERAIENLTSESYDKDQIISSLNMSISKNDEDVQAVRDIVAQKESTLYSLKAELDKKEQVISSLNMTIAQKDNHIDFLNESINQKKERAYEINNELEQLHGENEKLNQKLSRFDDSQNNKLKYTRGNFMSKKELTVSQKEIAQQKKTIFKFDVKISVVVVLDNTTKLYLTEMMKSIMKQTYKNWELCIVDISNDQNKHVEKICRSLSKKDRRIKYRKLKEPHGDASNLNTCIDITTGDYIAVFHQNDVLHQTALYEIAKLINEETPDFIYTDEQIFDSKTNNIKEFVFKPDFESDTIKSNNYIGNFIIYDKALIDKVGYFNNELDDSYHYDLVLRLTEKASTIYHLKKHLYYVRQF